MKSLATCGSLRAENRGVLFQQDTYFNAPRGRLKLREEANAAPQLVSYERSDLADQRESKYRLVTIEDADELKAALASTLGVRAVVVKQRQLFIWEDVRIHLDDVESLGSFIELEAVAPKSSDLSQEEERIRGLRNAFGIAEVDLVGGSYCDLIAGLAQEAG